MCRGIIERHGGQIIVIKKWDERKLAYEIGGQKRGTYIIAFFRPGTAVAGIERDVKLSEEILRVLVMRADHLNEQEMAAVEPQPISRARSRPAYATASYGDRGGYRRRGYGDGARRRSRRASSARRGRAR